MTEVIRNIIRGVGSLLEINPPPRRSRAMKNHAHKTDADLLAEDWQQVGRDIYGAMNQFQIKGETCEQKNLLTYKQ